MMFFRIEKKYFDHVRVKPGMMEISPLTAFGRNDKDAVVAVTGALRCYEQRAVAVRMARVMNSLRLMPLAAAISAAS